MKELPIATTATKPTVTSMATTARRTKVLSVLFPLTLESGLTPVSSENSGKSGTNSNGVGEYGDGADGDCGVGSGSDRDVQLLSGVKWESKKRRSSPTKSPDVQVLDMVSPDVF